MPITLTHSHTHNTRHARTNARPSRGRGEKEKEPRTRTPPSPLAQTRMQTQSEAEKWMDGLDGWKEPLMFLIPANASPKKASAPPITQIQAKKGLPLARQIKGKKK